MSSPVAQLNALTGLRFFAAFAVFVHHANFRFQVVDYHGPLGAQAVSFFFVLSGFILTYVYHDRLKPDGVKKFLFTRWARIWPLHATCFLIFWILNPNEKIFEGIWDVLRQVSHLFLLQSWIPSRQWILSQNGVAWSISTELFFYLMFPLFFLGGNRKFWKKFSLVLLLFLLALIGLKFAAKSPGFTERVEIQQVIHFNPAMRLIEFVTGMGVGFLFASRQNKFRHRPVWVDTLLEFAVLVPALSYDWFLREYLVYYKVRISPWAGPEFTNAMVYNGGLLFFAPLIYVFGKSRGLFGWLLSRPLIVYLGEISFALYMIHSLLLKLVFDQVWVGSQLDPYMAFCASFLISIGASILLYHLVEVPAKQSLLKLYEWKFGQAIGGVWSNFNSFCQSRAALWAAIVIVIPVMFLANERRWAKSQPPVEQIVNKTPPGMREMNWDFGMVLMGWSAERRRHGIQLNLVWRKESVRTAPILNPSEASLNYSRILYLVSEDGKRTAAFKRRKFSNRGAREKDLFVERLFLSKYRYQDTKKIEISFEPEIPGRNSGNRRNPNENRDLETITRVLINEARLDKLLGRANE